MATTILPGRTSLPKSPRNAPVVSEVRPYDLSMFAGEGMAAVAARARGFFSGLEVPVRVLALSEPFSAKPALEYVQDLILSTSPEEGWRRSGLAAYRHFLDSLVQEADLRRIRYFLVAWPGPELPPAAITRAAEDSFLTAVTPLSNGLPPFYGGRYREELDHLAPLERDQPYMAVYSAWELLGMWDLFTMHRLLLMPFPLAVSIDVETLSVDKAQFRLQSAYNGLYAQLNQQSKFGGKDARSEEAFHAVQETLKILEAGERLHMVKMAVLVKAPSAAKLKEYGAYIRNTLATHMRLRLETGQQKESLKLFTTSPPAEINVDVRPAPVLSGGAGVMMPFGLRSRSETAGILFGVDKNSGNPVFYDGWRRSAGEGGKPFHATILGRTGSGKTFTMQTLFHRLVLTGTQVIVIEPVGHFRRLAESLGAGGSYNKVAFGTASVNLLDMVQPTMQDQITHVHRQLALLLSSGTGAAATRSDLGRRVFTNAELGALDEALREIYASIWGMPITPATTPRLEDLCRRLDDVQGGAGLATEIRRLYVNGMLAGTFNRPTSLDLSLKARAVCFDVSGVDESYRPWFYMQIVASLLRHIRNPNRGYPVVIGFDEFKYLAQDPTLASQILLLVKTVRTYNAAIWTADQNPSSYTMNEESQQIIANTPLVFIGRQQAQDVQADRQLFPRLRDFHEQQMLTAGRGEFIGIFDDDYYPLRIEPSPLELGYFSGT
jgi:Cdc6-like AAA superfamily ATPase